MYGGKKVHYWCVGMLGYYLGQNIATVDNEVLLAIVNQDYFKLTTEIWINNSTSNVNVILEGESFFGVYMTVYIPWDCTGYTKRNSIIILLGN